VAAFPRVLVRDHHEMQYPDPDVLQAAGTSVHLLSRHLPHADAVELSPGRGDAPKRAGRLGHGTLPGGAMAARHLGSILSGS
jgi:hypothetical protein